MLTLLLAMCIGAANAARGAGINGGKVVVFFLMWIAAWTVTENIYLTLLFPIPQGCFWWQKGGTGVWHPIVIKALKWLPVPDDNDSLRWRFFEFSSAFIYSLLYLMICQK
jgi:hypothetical protein